MWWGWLTVVGIIAGVLLAVRVMWRTDVLEDHMGERWLEQQHRKRNR